MKLAKQLELTKPKIKKRMQKQPLRANIATIMETPSFTYQYVPTVIGPGKIIVANHMYEYHFKSKGVTFWHCANAPACNAEIITKGNEAWVLEDKHSH